MCHILSLASMIFGMIGIVDWKKWNFTDAYYYQVVASGHSWMGVLTIAFWCIQFVCGLWIYALTKWPPGTEHLKSQFVEVHNFTGYCLYASAIATCIMGYQDMQSTDAAVLEASVSTDDAAMNMALANNMTTSMYMPPIDGTYLGSVGTNKTSPTCFSFTVGSRSLVSSHLVSVVICDIP